MNLAFVQRARKSPMPSHTSERLMVRSTPRAQPSAKRENTSDCLREKLWKSELTALIRSRQDLRASQSTPGQTQAG